ncbi:winged helix-turn-helix transcriptional regulator [Microbacterium sp. NIBRBAC000506063]|uniref:winged helix-turn-helix transcriptional regulator n=1 Tax=Microbacterium sp. NIBRBAC000506063 TaxID=2734618 RepID=UPI001BB5AB0E|nr:helix-turn-helix domain-containing protein [Microbacterium sp. NIBRBAC000506063]QTV79786.1 helix-turn-helix transcriptional regulator [Microbacterium sp. NIBRBAC000506063]
MEWLDYDTGNCSVQRTLEVIGEKWTILVLREAFNGVRRFDQIRDHTGMSDAVLSARLRTLVDQGVLAAVPYKEPGARTRYEYRLTEKGLDLYPVLIALLQWGDKHRADPAGRRSRSSTVTATRRCGPSSNALKGMRWRCGRRHPFPDPERACGRRWR